jgi:photosystem II stability/assembly factor-like uncharacterized protein
MREKIWYPLLGIRSEVRCTFGAMIEVFQQISFKRIASVVILTIPLLQMLTATPGLAASDTALSDVTQVVCASSTFCVGMSLDSSNESKLRDVLIESRNSGSTWSKIQSRKGTDYLPNTISCGSPTTCIVLGDLTKRRSQGFILKTTNGGRSWFELPERRILRMNAVSCWTALNCLGIGSEGNENFSETTSNGGVIWTKRGKEPIFLPALDCFDSLHCLADGLSLSTVNVAYTNSGGKTWNARTLKLGFLQSSTVSCIGPSTCLLSSEPTIARTMNGGRTVADALSAKQSKNVNLVGNVAVDCVEGRFCYAVGNLQDTNPFVLKSVNGGITWAYTNAHNLTPNPTSLSCVNKNVCVVAGGGTFHNNRSISRTTNGGLSWQSEYVPRQRS